MMTTTTMMMMDILEDSKNCTHMIGMKQKLQSSEPKSTILQLAIATLKMWTKL